MKTKLTMTLAKGIMSAWEGRETDEQFARKMANRKIPRKMWEAVIDKDEDALKDWIHGSEPIEDEDFQKACPAIGKYEEGHQGRVITSDNDDFGAGDPYSRPQTRGENTHYSRWQ